MPRHRSSRSSRLSGWRTATWPWLVLWALGLATLIGVCALLQVPRMERKILGNVQSAVAPIISAPVMVAVDGHTATITGPAADVAERDALLSAIAESRGVRRVVDEITLPATPGLESPPEVLVRPETPIATADPDRPPEPDPQLTAVDLPLDERPEALPTSIANRAPDNEPAPPGEPLPSLTLRLDGRALTLEGRMSADDDLTALIQPTLAAFDPSYLTNRIDTSGPAAPADWMTPLVALLPDLAELDNPAVHITGRQIILSGVASTREQHDRVIDTALEAFDDYALVERIEVGPGGSGDAAAVASPAAAAPAGNQAAQDTPPRPASSPVPRPSADSLATNVAAPDDIGSSAAMQREIVALGGQRLLFESNSDQLTSGSEPRLDALAALFIKYPDVRVEIEGHTDASGPADANLSLSQKRASAVLGALVDRGVPRKRLVAYGYGEGVPLVDNSTPAGRARNRRIEFRF